jgi:hypothetical protein
MVFELYQNLLLSLQLSDAFFVDFNKAKAKPYIIGRWAPATVFVDHGWLETTSILTKLVPMFECLVSIMTSSYRLGLRACAIPGMTRVYLLYIFLKVLNI